MRSTTQLQIGAAATLAAAAFVHQRAWQERGNAALETRAVIVAGAHDRYINHRRHSVALQARLPRSELVLSPRAIEAAAR